MTDTVQQFHACLDQETTLISQFIDLLQAESDVLLSGGDADALASSTAQKNRFADQLSAWDDQRQTLLTELGYSPDKAGLDAAVQAHPQLQPSCDALYQKAAQARQMNEANGQIISTFMIHNQEAQDTLARLADPGQLYDASGMSRPGKKGPKTNIKIG